MPRHCLFAAEILTELMLDAILSGICSHYIVGDGTKILLFPYFVYKYS